MVLEAIQIISDPSWLILKIAFKILSRVGDSLFAVAFACLLLAT
jgi:hypothetical protein